MGCEQQTKLLSILEQALETPCPFCGYTNLSANVWSVNEGEVDAVECNKCLGSAPADSWVIRKQLK